MLRYHELKDKRTSYRFKQIYAWFLLFFTFFGIITNSGFISLHNKCDVFRENRFKSEEKSFFIISIVSIICLTILLILSMGALIFPAYYWFEVSVRPSLGQDVEDVDPFILDRSGHRLYMNSHKNRMKIQQLSGEFYNILDN